MTLEVVEEEQELIDRAEKEFMKAIENEKAAVQQPEDIMNDDEEVKVMLR